MDAVWTCGLLVIVGLAALAGWLAHSLHTDSRDLHLASYWRAVAADRDEVIASQQAWVDTVAAALRDQGHAPVPGPGATAPRVCLACQGRCRYVPVMQHLAAQVPAPREPLDHVAGLTAVGRPA